MITPEVPRGGAIGQAVFHHQSDSHGDDALCVMAARWGEVGQIGTEEDVAGGTVMLGVDHMKETGTVSNETAEIV